MKIIEADRMNWLRAGSWITYDFANTIYSFVVVTWLMSPALEQISRSNFAFSFVSTCSMIAAGFVVPVIGVWTDRRACSKRMVGWITAGCALACIGLAVVLNEPLGWIESYDRTLPPRDGTMFYVFIATVFFFVANILYQTALMPYNCLLVVAAPKEAWGRISGIGVGIGYFGSLFSLILFTAMSIDYPPIAILLSAVAMVFFTLPLLIFVPERAVAECQSDKPINIISPLKELFDALKTLPKNRPLFLGLIGNFLCVDALNTLIAFMSVYVIKTVYAGSSSLDDPIKYLLGGMIISSVAWSFVNGWLSDKIGSIQTMLFSAVMLAVSIICGIAFTSWPTVFYWTVVPTCGAGLSGMWIAGRKMVADLSPVEHRGLFFGLYGMTNKVGAITTVLFAVLTHLPLLKKLGEATSYRIALSTLLIPVVIAAVIFIVLLWCKPQQPVEIEAVCKDSSPASEHAVEAQDEVKKLPNSEAQKDTANGN